MRGLAQDAGAGLKGHESTAPGDCSTLRFFSNLACTLLVLWQCFQIS